MTMGECVVSLGSFIPGLPSYRSQPILTSEYLIFLFTRVWKPRPKPAGNHTGSGSLVHDRRNNAKIYVLS